MQLSETLQQEKKTVFAQLSDMISRATETPLGMLSYVLVGPFFFLTLLAISTLSSFLLGSTFVVTLAGVYLLLSWKEKGLYAAFGLTTLAYITRLVWGLSEAPLWEFFFALSHSVTFFVTYQTFEECQAQIEDTTVALEEDFEKLKKVHATYTKEKARECEDLQESLITAKGIEKELKSEIESLEKVVLESAAVATRLQDQVLVLEQDVETALAKAPQENPLDQKLLKEVNELRVTAHQRQLLIDELIEERDALKTEKYQPQTDVVAERATESVNTEVVQTAAAEHVEEEVAAVQETGSELQAEAPPKEEKAFEQKQKKLSKNALLLQRLGAHSPKASPKGELHEKEQEKIRIKKEYYALLDECNDLKADPEKKSEYETSFEQLKAKKAELVTVEKELFSLKKELRDSGKLFS